VVRIERIARAAIEGDAIELRSLVQDFLRSNPRLADIPRPNVSDERTLTASAGLIELFALRTNQEPPAWTKEIGALDKPVFLVKGALKMRRLRELCQTESPLPLRKRNLYAPPNYLEFA